MANRAIVWADDDHSHSRLLAGLQHRILSLGVSLHLAEDYDRAVEALHLAALDVGATNVSLLCDVVVARNDAIGAMSPSLGIRLAEFAATIGVDRIVFLTVVPTRVVARELEQLRRSFAEVSVSYFDKTQLTRFEIQRLLRTLRREPSEPDP